MAEGRKKGPAANGFQVYYHSPRRGGVPCFSGSNLLVWALSALQWKRLNPGRLKLYADAKTAELLSHSGLMSLWDEVDDRMLDRNIDETEFDSRNFFALGKFFAYLMEEAPCCAIDIDLIFWRPAAPFLEGKAAVFTHLELAEPESRWYYDPRSLHAPFQYKFHDSWNFKMPVANTSFLYFQDNRLKNYYAEEGLRFMRRNFMEAPPEISAEALFAEQRMLPLCLAECGRWEQSGSLLDARWDAKNGLFVAHDAKFGPWEFYQLDNPLITHVWIAKKAIQKNKKFQDYYGCRLLEMIRGLDAKIAASLERMDSVEPYARMLGCDTVDRLLKKGIVSNRLYPEGS